MKGKGSMASQKMPPGGVEQAEAIAVEALAFMAGDAERLGKFLAQTGLGPENLRQAAAEPGFFAGVLRHLIEDESLLMAFAANAGLQPEVVARAASTLGGPQTDWDG
jgi:Protein of unknown function (DUF3572)